MNRPTRNTLFGMGLCLVLATFYACKARAETDNTVRDQLITGFQKCVLEEAFTSIQPNHKIRAEQAFTACNTEEQAFRSWMQLAGVPVEIAQGLVLRLKLDLKKVIAP